MSNRGKGEKFRMAAVAPQAPPMKETMLAGKLRKLGGNQKTTTLLCEVAMYRIWKIYLRSCLKTALHCRCTGVTNEHSDGRMALFTFLVTPAEKTMPKRRTMSLTEFGWKSQKSSTFLGKLTFYREIFFLFFMEMGYCFKGLLGSGLKFGNESWPFLPPGHTNAKSRATSWY